MDKGQAGRGAGEGDEILTREECLAKQAHLIGVGLHCERYPLARERDGAAGVEAVAADDGTEGGAPGGGAGDEGKGTAPVPAAAAAPVADAGEPPVEAAPTRPVPTAAASKPPVGEATSTPSSPPPPAAAEAELMTREACLQRQSRMAGVSLDCGQYPGRKELHEALSKQGEDGPAAPPAGPKAVYRQLMQEKAKQAHPPLTERQKACLERNARMLGVGLRCVRN